MDVSVELSEELALKSERCTSSPAQQRGKECGRGPTVHSSAILCVTSRSGRALASRPECAKI